MTPNAHIKQYDASLYQVQLPVPLEGFEGFLGAWVYTGDPTVLVDVGPATAGQALLGALSDLGLSHPDYILLTHIHIDHSGGIGAIARKFTHTPVVCHPKAVPHVIDPQRLWQGSLKTLGDTARAYGPIDPVEANRIIPTDRLSSEDIRAVQTPGHAAHHCSYLIGDLLFAGEAGGVCLTLDNNRFYLRPATPPRFFLETSLDSIDRLLELKPQRICYGHVGRRDDARSMLRLHREQLLRWRALIQSFKNETGKDNEAAIPACCEHLLINDPLLACFAQLEPKVQQRERGFLINSIKGFWGYLSETQVDPPA
jgi:glyoxylase-like metal-dependent hydrolase (beta-lactamase superfamily II)